MSVVILLFRLSFISKCVLRFFYLWSSTKKNTTSNFIPLLKSINQSKNAPTTCKISMKTIRIWQQICVFRNSFCQVFVFRMKFFFHWSSSNWASYKRAEMKSRIPGIRVRFVWQPFGAYNKDLEYNGCIRLSIQSEYQMKDSLAHRTLCNRFWCYTHELKQVRIWLTLWWFILWIVSL